MCDAVLQMQKSPKDKGNRLMGYCCRQDGLRYHTVRGKNPTLRSQVETKRSILRLAAPDARAKRLADAEPNGNGNTDDKEDDENLDGDAVALAHAC
jgi:hypothetical protein